MAAVIHCPSRSYPLPPLNANKRYIRVFRLQPGENDDEISGILEMATLDQFTWRTYPSKDHHVYRESRVFWATQAEFLETAEQHCLPSRTCLSQCRSTRGLQHQPSCYRDLVSLQVPSCGADPCQCFEAFSYTWGPSNGNYTIRLCGNARFRVTDNLFHALKRLRYKDHTRVLWIDALCINQDDFGERAQQVRLMSEIYRTCWNLVIWIGDSTVIPPTTPDKFSFDRRSIEDQYFETDKAVYRSALREATANARSVWWLRMWTMPEIIAFGFNPEPEVAIGSIRMPWFAFVEVLEVSTEHLLSIFLSIVDLHHIARSNYGRLSILDIVGQTRLADCEDPRDKVYSILGIIKKEEAVLLEPDYSPNCTSAMAFTDATCAVIMANRDLKALTEVDVDQHRDPEMPSWAIDFENRRYDSSFMCVARSFDHILRNAWTKRPASPQRRILATRESLHARGQRFDRVRACVSLSVCGTCDWQSDWETVSTALEGVLLQIPRHDPYCNLKRANANSPRDQSRCIVKCQGHQDWYSPSSEAQPFLIHLVDRGLALKIILDTWYRQVSLPEPNNSNPEQAAFTNRGRTFFVTEAGFIGVGDNCIRERDTVALLYGSEHPAILRRHHEADETQYTFCGLAIVCGIDRGELIDRVPDLELPEEDFVIR